MTYASDKLERGASTIHEIGCLTREDLPRGEIVGVFDGDWMVLPMGPDYQPVYPPGVDPRYCIDVVETYIGDRHMCVVLNPVPQGPARGTPLDRINHSWTPNCAVVGLAVMTAQAIPAGTELTIDYSTLDCTEIQFAEEAA